MLASHGVRAPSPQRARILTHHSIPPCHLFNATPHGSYFSLSVFLLVLIHCRVCLELIDKEKAQPSLSWLGLSLSVRRAGLYQ